MAKDDCVTSLGLHGGTLFVGRSVQIRDLVLELFERGVPRFRNFALEGCAKEEGCSYDELFTFETPELMLRKSLFFPRHAPS